MEYLIAVGLILTAYFVGGIPFCLILGKVTVGKDIRQLGDHNPGAWNLLFNANRLWGVVGALLDAGKGAFAFWLGLRFGGPLVGYLAAVAAVAGHNWSPFLRFSGGKGVAATLGGLVAIFPLALIVYAFLVTVLLLVTRRMAIGILGALLGSLLFLIGWNRDLASLLYSVALLTVMAPKYLIDARGLKAEHGSSEQNRYDLFTAKPR
jgi:glycerol-3-phosphate acyltransferase PlsY